MGFTRNSDHRVRYSPSEKTLLELLVRAKEPLDTLELTRRFYNHKRNVPFNGANVVGGTLRRLAAKVNFNREKFTIVRTGKRPKSWAVNGHNEEPCLKKPNTKRQSRHAQLKLKP